MRPQTKKLLALSVVEKDVESQYRDEIRHHRPALDIDSPYGGDGYARCIPTCGG